MPHRFLPQTMAAKSVAFHFLLRAQPAGSVDAQLKVEQVGLLQTKQFNPIPACGRVEADATLETL